MANKPLIYPNVTPDQMTALVKELKDASQVTLDQLEPNKYSISGKCTGLAAYAPSTLVLEVALTHGNSKAFDNAVSVVQGL